MAYFKVVGTQPLALADGRAVLPGESFAAEFPPEGEEFLTRIGAIARVEAPSVPSARKVVDFSAGNREEKE